ncbi:hypothetical protein BS78_08G044100 [Paspalum vaginatum]|nr:hypothetical protein BS78_08G044100 [Paspalum vaginatum]
MKRQRRALVQLVVLFCEALRFKHLLARLMEIMASGQSIKLPPHMWDWFRKWSSISKFALDCKHRDSIEEEDDDADLLLNITAFGINNKEDVAGFLGLILHTARL